MKSALLVRPLFCVGLLLLATGCAAVRPTPEGATAPKAVYAAFRAAYAPKTPAPAFSLAGSMSFSSHGKSGRLNYRFFGNDTGPCRLDLTTAMGGPYAHLHEEGTAFTAYLPSRDTVYTHTDTRRGAARLGIPLPFTLREMAALLDGRIGQLAPATYASAKKVRDGYIYHFSGNPRLSDLTLDFTGKPRHLTGRGVEPWQVDFTSDEAVPGLTAEVARRLTLTTPGGSSLIIRVKSLQLRSTAYPVNDLELPVPSHAATHSLDTPGDEALLPDL